MRRFIALTLLSIIMSISTISCAAQHDMVIDNATAATVRADINNALAALVTNSSGATAPSTTYPYQMWADTTTGYMKIRNAANNAWITTYALANGPAPHTGASTITTVGTITSGSWNAGYVAATYHSPAAGAIMGNNNDAAGNGVFGMSTAGTGLSGISTTGRGAYAGTTQGTAISAYQTGTQSGNLTNPTLEIVRNNANANYTTAGNIIDITDNPTGSGAISGSLLRAIISNTERLNYNPRVADGASAVAYSMDTVNALSNAGAKLLSLKNNGTEQLAVATNGALKLKSGTGKSIGQATLVGGTVTVTNTAVTANSRIFLTVSTAGGTRGYLSTTKSAGASFTINSTSASDTSTVDWLIVESM